jgi:flagellar hook assembly protein FlgD
MKENIRRMCPRFVLKVDIIIVDRWGKQVFSYASGGENSIFIDWDGRDDNGKVLSDGVYFYTANVTFETLDPKDSKKVIKGWVQLVRPD